MEEPASNIRLFAGLPVEDTLRKRISTIPRDLKGRWVLPEDLHITIRYLGPTEPARLPVILNTLQRVQIKPFGIEVSGLSCFSSKKQNVVYADVQSTRKLTHLCAEVTDALSPLGFDFGVRPFEPHITIARLDKRVKPEPYIAAHSSKIQAGWIAEGFHLFRSAEPGGKGQRYSSLGWFPFLTH